MKNYLLTASVIFTLLVILASCRQKAINNTKSGIAGKMEQMSWILGEWIQTDSIIRFHEKWELTPENTFEGFGYLMADADTIFAEDLQIKISGSDIYYIPTIMNQNDGKEVLFRLDSLGDNIMVFVNPQHDFPSKIVYSHPTTDSLHAWIEGLDKGKLRREDFRMVRKK